MDEEGREKARLKYGPVEVKNIGNNYYLSRVSSVYDPERRNGRGRYLESTLRR